MEQKYWVPAIERANGILNAIAMEPSVLRLIDLSNQLGINKSSMFSLLNTMEVLGWIVREKGDTYSLGPAAASLGAAYFRKFSILQRFAVEAKISVQRVNENIQLGVLDGGNVVYLAREEGTSPVRLVTDPGMRFPAYASAIGKVQLSQYSYTELLKLYPDRHLVPKTAYTLTDIDELWAQLESVRSEGFAVEMQEGAQGFCCVAAPVLNHENRITAGVSFTMLEGSWKEKKEVSRLEIIDLARRLSLHAGHSVETSNPS